MFVYYLDSPGLCVSPGESDEEWKEKTMETISTKETATPMLADLTAI